MAADLELLTTREAAVVAGVEVRDINRLIDEHILPEELFRNEDTRLMWSGACVLARFYYRTERSLTADERMGAIRFVCHEAKHSHHAWAITTWRRSRPRWTYHHDHYLTLSFEPFITDTITQHDKLEKAREIVSDDPKILSGTPVIKGTRVPVYDVAASAAKGLTPAEIKEDYPSLDEEMIELAIIYAKATPQRGRPPSSTRRTEATRKTVKRRKA